MSNSLAGREACKRKLGFEKDRFCPVQVQRTSKECTALHKQDDQEESHVDVSQQRCSQVPCLQFLSQSSIFAPNVTEESWARLFN